MPSRILKITHRSRDAADPVDTIVLDGLSAVREELDVPGEFPPEVRAEAQTAARNSAGPIADRTSIPFVTIDPPSSMDLDQAVHVERRDDGFTVHYAIADVATFVIAGGTVDREARRRVETLYAPDTRTPLHPTVLSEDATSLLADQVRPALLWEIELDAKGNQVSATVARASVRSRAKLSYEEVQRRLDDDSADEPLQLLREVGRLREDIERERGGVSLPTPEQEVVRENGHWSLVNRGELPVEGWNAQISLLTGMAAARIMLDGGIGILRTLPPADPRDVARLRRVAAALRVEWPQEQSYQDFIRALDPAEPAAAAVLAEATSLLRGAAYVAFDGQPPPSAEHSAIAAPYAHATAPLRRLVDRFVGELCVCLSAGVPVPAWVREALPTLPELMAAGDRRASAYERACVDLVEAALLADKVGAVFEGVIVDVHEGKPQGTVQLAEPAARGRIDGTNLPLGERVSVRLVEASVQDRRVRFELAALR